MPKPMMQTDNGLRLKTETWGEIVRTVSNAFRLTDNETERFSFAPVPRLIGAIPFVAGCSFPERTALSHLGAYLLAYSSPVFNHAPEDSGDPYSRFYPIMNFQNGDHNIIRAGMGRLALVSYGDHLRDQAEDLMNGKYNPVSSGEWDASTQALFLADAEYVEVQEFEKIIPASQSILTFWSY